MNIEEKFKKELEYFVQPLICELNVDLKCKNRSKNLL